MNKCLLVEARYDCRSKDKRKDFSDKSATWFFTFLPGLFASDFATVSSSASTLHLVKTQ